MLQAEEILQKYWGYPSFRHLQKEIIQSVVAGKDTLALMPTGGGKSICYQVPALMMEGICLVISPLIALMKDQVDLLRKKGVPATAVFSGMTSREIDIALDNCIYGKTKLLYLSPERLITNLAKERIAKMDISLLAVDEAHCISQWGYDFRPPYLRIAEFREWKPKTPVLALTATATPEVVEDIQEKLSFRKKNVLQMSFRRENLAYVVLHEDDKMSKLLKICKNVGGSGIVYVRNRKKTEQIADYLKKNGIRAIGYHAGMQSRIRDATQMAWSTGATPVIAATNAFGMGIDKPDVRFVVHMDLPDSLEAYFQEAGRAGRDGKQSWAVLLFSPADKKTVERNFENSFPSIDEIRTVYQALANHLQIATGAGLGCSYDFDIDTFCASYKLKPLLVFHCMKFLEKEGYITTTDALHLPSRIHFIADRNALYRFQLQNEDADRLVKTMLRSYPGMFEDYVSVREGMISKRSGMPVADLKRLLKLMSEHKILSYIPQNEHPQIIFNVGRMPARDINIKQENLSDLKQRTWQRIEAMLHYAETRKTCRSRILLSYFGEIQEHNCGKCDVCIEEKNKFVKSGEYAKLSTVIKELLAVRNLTLSELIIRTKNKEEKALSVIRWMVDNGEIHYTDKDMLSLSI